MKFKRQLKRIPSLEQINLAPLIDVILLLLIFFMLSSSFTFQSGINVKLPKAVTSDALENENFIISITSEDIIYLSSKIVTLKELEKRLKEFSRQQQPILIKADRRSSMGRIVDVWDLCRKLNIDRINIATDQN